MGKAARGTRHNHGSLPKLTDEQSEQIKRRRAAGETIKGLAEAYGVTTQTINKALIRNEAGCSLADFALVGGNDHGA